MYELATIIIMSHWTHDVVATLNQQGRVPSGLFMT